MERIKLFIVKVLLALTPQKLINIYRDNDLEFSRRSYAQANDLEFARFSYSQEGEDLVLSRFLEASTTGFYVDIGAHHPKRFSNTYFFYKKGWRGINIDAMPGSMEAFKRDRPEDINLEIAISDKKQALTYYLFNEPALNGFSEAVSKERDGAKGYSIIGEKKIETNTLKEVLDKNLPTSTQIDFMSIDIEGYDFEALVSNDWQKYRPRFVLVEDLGTHLNEINKSKLGQFMEQQGYQLCAKTYFTYFFMKNEDNRK
ncbi:MAG: FkbM family methyltransferase [Minisyncoccota bacterium]